MTAILPAIEAYISARCGVRPEHARGGAIFCLAALTPGWRLPNGQSLKLNMAFTGDTFSAEDALQGVEQLIWRVGVPTPPSWEPKKGKRYEKFMRENPDAVLVDPFGISPCDTETISMMLWFNSTPSTEPDRRPHGAQLPDELVANCKALYESSGIVKLNPDVAPMQYAGDDEEERQIALTTLRLASLLALGSGRDRVCSLDLDSANEMVLANLLALGNRLFTKDSAALH